MTPVDSAILRDFRSRLEQRATVHELVLFGSRARGDADAGSDLDVLVVVDEPVGDELREYVSECAWEAGFEHGIVVVPVVFSGEEWERGPERNSLLAQAIRSEGVPV
jgi:predicted nucleotidyltransferase